MMHPLLLAIFASLLMIVSAPGRASIEEPQPCAQLGTSPAAGDASAEIIGANVESGMSLAEATVAAMICGGESNRTAIATAGIEMASNLAQARSVADAVLA